MKKTLLIMFLPLLLFSQEIVVDSEGNQILLNPDGTWEYLSNERDILFEFTANELNKLCPMVIDEYTRLTSSVYIDGEFIYNYVIDTGFFYEFDISKSDWERIQLQSMKNTFCTDPDFQTFRDYEMNMVWKYYDLTGKYFSKIEIHTSDCY